MLINYVLEMMRPSRGVGGGGAKKYVLENLLIKSCLADQVFCNTNHALQAS